jgi:adenine-specific DNA-methyltransferase
VKDGNISHITREPEQVRAFRDTWRDGIHSYLSYLRDRLTVCRDLLHQSGSVFVQIGDENIHRVRALMDEVFGEGNFISLIGFAKTTGSTEDFLGQTTDYLLWYAKDKSHVKFRQAMRLKKAGERGGTNYNRVRDAAGFSQSLSTDVQDDPALAAGELEIYSLDNLTSQSAGRDKGEGAASWFGVHFNGRILKPSLAVRWKTNEEGMARLKIAGRLEATKSRLGYVRYLRDFPAVTINNRWDDVGASFMADKVYVVQTSQTVVQRCLLLATDPGDLVLDPTCGSGTTAVVAEHWGRRWITIDTSRVALILSRSRIMAARYPYYLLADSKAGVLKEAEITRTDLSDDVTQRYCAGNIRQGFVYERIPHIQLSDIARNAELDVIWESLQPAVVDALAELNTALKGHKRPFEAASGGRAGKSIDFAAPAGRTVKLPSGEDAPANALLEWEVPREAPDDWPESAKKALEAFWLARIARQKEIDASIAAKADFEYLYDKPYEDKKKVRVAGPFTVESLSPHRMLHVGADDELIDPLEAPARTGDEADFASMILENLKTAGVQQAHKEDKITFSSISPWPGRFIAAEGRYVEGENGDGAEKRAGIFVGPEFGTVSRQDLVAAAREAGDADFDVLIACAFNYEAHASEFSKLGRIPVLKARMNADLHMADDLKNTGKGNLFVIFGEPDIDILPFKDGDAEDGGTNELVQVKINGVDVFHPSSGEVRSDGAEGIACWFIDTDYNEESFFVRHAYFLGANDPYKSLKTTLKAEINEDAWATLNSDTSRPFPKPKGGRIAVKVINHLGDEVMKVFRVE